MTPASHPVWSAAAPTCSRTRENGDDDDNNKPSLSHHRILFPRTCNTPLRALHPSCTSALVREPYPFILRRVVLSYVLDVPFFLPQDAVLVHGTEANVSWSLDLFEEGSAAATDESTGMTSSASLVQDLDVGKVCG